MSQSCLSCSQVIPPSIIVDGKRHKIFNKRKYCFNCSPWGARNNRTLESYDPINKICTKCKENKNRNDFSGTDGKCKLCTSTEKKIQRHNFKKKCIAYKNNNCHMCGYNKCPAALQFHHNDPSEKDFAISRFRHIDFESAKKELDKCILLCGNCHAELHFNAEA